jgi:outer membrane protein assembly factor BamB
MKQSTWTRSWFVFAPLALLLPPLALVWLWLRSGVRIWIKALASVALLILTVGHLIAFYGMRVELDGTGMPRFVTFRSPERRFEAVERSRAAQPSTVPAAAPTVIPTLTPAAVVTEPAAVPVAPKVEPAYWTDFRGPQRDGVYRQGPISTNWPAKGLPRLWKQPIGGGYASFVIAGNKLFTIEQRRQKEFVVAYDVLTGHELWTHSYDAIFHESMGGDGPRATPTWHEGLLYSLGATGEFRVLDADTGKVKWSRNILADNDAQNLPWGMAASPLIVDEKVIVQPGGSPGKSVVAYQKLTGQAVWKSLDDKQAYTSPMVVTLAGRRQIITATAKRVVGLAVEDGALLWDFPWVTEYDVNSAQPVILDANRFVISAGYGHGSALVEVKPSGTGFTAQAVWQNNRMKNRFNSSVLLDGYLYGLDEGILSCIDARTGELKWKGGRYGYGQTLLAGSHLVVLTETGDLVLVKATPDKHEELARFEAISGKTWNVPAIADGRLFVRNEEEMACFRIAP